MAQKQYISLSALGLVLAACSGSSGSGEPADPVGGNTPEDVAQATASLTRTQSCDELLSRIHNDAIAQLNATAERMKSGEDEYGYGRSDIAVGGGVAIAEGNPDSGPVATPAPSAPTDIGGDGDGDSDDAFTSGEEGAGMATTNQGGGFSGTNVQVGGVDEADIVKSDGDNLYVLHGAELHQVGAWPADETELLDSTRIEGEPREMFVKDGRAVVFSNVWNVESLLQDNPDIDVNSDAYYDLYYPYDGVTKITVVDFTDDGPVTRLETYREGSYRSARLHGDLVRAVVEDGYRVPYLGDAYVEYYDPFGERYPQDDIDAQVDSWVERTRGSIERTTLDHWIPRAWERNGDEVSELPPLCGDFYVPDPGLTESGVTTIAALNMGELDAAVSQAVILGNADRVYANHDVFVLAHTDHRFDSRVVSSTQTALHLFQIDGDNTTYQASGFVPGYIHNQFSLDERGGVIRVSTTQETWQEVEDEDFTWWDFGEPVNQVLTVAADGSALNVIGSTEEFGENETIFATRFVGDRGYVVTFRQTDPLFVIDLSDPENPTRVGELHIPGFSDYLHPLDENHLLALGRDGDEEGFDLGQALQIFNVEDPENPTLLHKYVFNSEGYSEGNMDHRAIAFHPEQDLIAFPFQSWETGPVGTLEVFEVTAEDGFERRGSITHAVPEVDLDACARDFYGVELDELPAEEREWIIEELTWECQPNWVEFRRGVFRDDFVYGVSTAGVTVCSLDDLATPIVDLELPYSDPYNYYGDDFREPGFAEVGSTTPGSAAMPPALPPESEPAEPMPTPDEAMEADAGSSEPME